MNSWLNQLAAIEELEDAEFDAALVAGFERGAADLAARPIRFSTPTFKEYTSTELSGCNKNSFPAFSITAGACGLNCDHCQARILEPMIPATNPAMLEATVRSMIATQGLNGFLLSGGSNKRNEIAYGRFLPVVERLKRDFPHLRIAVHSALLDEQRARDMAAAGVDTVMMDVIGADDTIREVYKLERPVEDFERTLAALCATDMEVTPHIVIGLHYGRLLGEANALDIVSRYPVTALVLVVIMPFYAKPDTFVTPDTTDAGHIFAEARQRLPDKQVLLGCARPPGMHKRVTDAYAIMAGLDGIAFPADGAVAVARMTGRPFEQAHSCCSIRLGGERSLQTPPCSGETRVSLQQLRSG
ncbi:MAG: radical SAM protein [Gammaproteobacteria bacterium]|nr:radical SAM protein [Gammaproteobacteria bacterium]